MDGIKELKEKILNDEAFSKKLMEVQSAEELQSKVKELGFEVTVEELETLNAAKTVELSDDDLDDINGGVFSINMSCFFNKLFSPRKVTTDSISTTDNGIRTLEYNATDKKNVKISNGVYQNNDVKFTQC